jgi:hypothetical protein
VATVSNVIAPHNGVEFNGFVFMVGLVPLRLQITVFVCRTDPPIVAGPVIGFADGHAYVTKRKIFQEK